MATSHSQPFPYGVNPPPSGAFSHLGNPFGLPPRPPWVAGNQHGSVELGGRARSPAERARPRSRERRTISPVSRTPISARAGRPRAEGVEQEIRFDDFDARIRTLEAMAVTHAQLLQEVHNETKGISQIMGQIVEKIKTPTNMPRMSTSAVALSSKKLA